MPTLPDWTALGSAPSGNSGRPISTTKDVSGEVSRTMLGNAAAAGDSWRGLQQLGAGLEKIGDAGMRIAASEQEAHSRLDYAKAQADLSGGMLGLREQLSTETDQNALRTQYRDRGLGVLNTVAQNIGDPALRELFIAKNQDTIDNFALHANERANQLYRNDYIAGLDQTREGLMKAFVSAKDNNERQLYLKQWGEFLDAASQAGVIPADKAVEDMNLFTKGASKSYIVAQPPAQRLAILGGVRPGEVAAKDLAPTDAGLLNAIAGPESGGKYNVRYGGSFDDFSRHPNVREPIKEGPNAGKFSTAAGRYQFTKDTWDDAAKALGLTDFSPESQDRAALWLAKKTYLEKTGHSLDADIQKNGGLTADMLDVLSTKKGGRWEGFDSDKGKAKALAAYRATSGNKIDLESAHDLAEDPHVAVLTPEEHRALLHGAAQDYTQETQQRYLDRKNAEAAVNQKLADDWASVTTTGEPTESLTPEEVGRVFGPQRRQEFERNRQIGKDYWLATHDFDQLSDAEIRQRLETINPANHSGEGAKKWTDLYKTATSKAKEIITLRSKDPAAAADRLPDVAAARQAVDLGGGEPAQQELIKARMKAFQIMGVPEERQIPMTQQEAKDLVAPVLIALDNKQTKKALEEVTNKVRATYGDEMTSRVIGFALKAARADQETADVAGKVIRSLFKPAQTVPPEALEQTMKEEAANKAMASFVDPSPSYGGFAGPDGYQGAFYEGSPRVQPAAKRYPPPNDTAIRMLIEQPTQERAAQFDSVFGPGASTKILKQAGAASPEMERPVSPTLLGGNS